MCADPEQVWYPQRTICFATQAREWAQAAYGRLHEKRPWHPGDFSSWAKEPNDDTGEYQYGASDGVTIFVAPVDIDPADDFTSNPVARPAVLRTQQVDGDHHQPDN